MSVNIGSPAIAAVQELRGSPRWQDFISGLREVAQQRADAALAAPTGGARDDACGYARALRDIYVALQAAAQNVNPNQVKKPGAIKD